MLQERQRFQNFPPVLDATGVLSFNDENNFNLNSGGHVISYLVLLKKYTGPALPKHKFLSLHL
jgi:hypothetical protein